MTAQKVIILMAVSNAPVSADNVVLYSCPDDEATQVANPYGGLQRRHLETVYEQGRLLSPVLITAVRENGVGEGPDRLNVLPARLIGGSQKERSETYGKQHSHENPH